MAQFAALKAGLLLIAGSQASDVSDQGFLSKFVPVGTQRAPTSLNGYVPDGLSEAEYKASVNAEKTKANKNKQRFPTGKDRTLNVADYLKNLEGKQTFKGDKVTGSGHTYAKQKFDSKEAFDKAAGRFGKFILPAVSNVKQDSMAFKEFQSSKISAGEEEKSAQTLFANDSSMPITLPAIGVGLLALVTMIVARMRTGATSVLAPGLSDNFMEMQSQGTDLNSAAGAARRETSARVGWGQLSSQNSHPPTLCYAQASDRVREMEGITMPMGFFDPLGLSNNASDELICWYREAELKHGRVAMAAFVGFLVNYQGISFPADLTMSGEKFSSLGTKAPLAAWDNLSDRGKWSILGFIGLLELLGEAEKPHYMRGGKSGTNNLVWYFGEKYLSGKTEEQKRSSRTAEINNGRLAMLGVMSLIAGSTIQGSVPFFAGVPLEQYTGSVWAPF
jgi:hypothetical protein